MSLTVIQEGIIPNSEPRYRNTDRSREILESIIGRHTCNDYGEWPPIWQVWIPHFIVSFYALGFLETMESLDKDAMVKLIHQIEQVSSLIGNRSLTKNQILSVLKLSVNRNISNYNNDIINVLPIGHYIHADIIDNIDNVLAKGLKLHIFHKQ